ncbi:low molecular weight phosphatase family protein [Sinomonas sp. P47F7]|uniref:arsenate reductase/protein-tyrosine-phosphatase family protein n=1 Tax=Sinomonas sp. P47F7 TaxID=3410987 RepID=UPI003BF52729
MFSILFVCSGNICRSPIAEQLLRTRMANYPITVSSAGVIAEEGTPMTEEAATVSRRYGGEPDGHRARMLTEFRLREADLVLTATRAHRGAVVQLLPRMSRKTFTVCEFARLLSAVPEHERVSLEDPSALVDAVRAVRGHVAPPEDPEHDDIEDPYRQPIEIYEAVGARLDVEVAVIVDGLRMDVAGQ